jgi:hypothetical protein
MDTVQYYYYPEYGRSTFFRNVGKCISDYAVSPCKKIIWFSTDYLIIAVHWYPKYGNMTDATADLEALAYRAVGTL